MPDSVWRAGFEGEGLERARRCSRRSSRARSGLVFTVDDHDATWRRLTNRTAW